MSRPVQSHGRREKEIGVIFESNHRVAEIYSRHRPLGRTDLNHAPEVESEAVAASIGYIAIA